MNGHITGVVLGQYVTGGGTESWAVEAHLERCALCRERLGAAVAKRSPATAVLVERVQATFATEIIRSPRMPVRRLPRWVCWWAPPGLWPRLAMRMLVLG